LAFRLRISSLSLSLVGYLASDYQP